MTLNYQGQPYCRDFHGHLTQLSDKYGTKPRIAKDAGGWFAEIWFAGFHAYEYGSDFEDAVMRGLWMHEGIVMGRAPAFEPIRLPR